MPVSAATIANHIKPHVTCRAWLKYDYTQGVNKDGIIAHKGLILSLEKAFRGRRCRMHLSAHAVHTETPK